MYHLSPFHYRRCRWFRPPRTPHLRRRTPHSALNGRQLPLQQILLLLDMLVSIKTRRKICTSYVKVHVIKFPNVPCESADLPCVPLMNRSRTGWSPGARAAARHSPSPTVLRRRSYLSELHSGNPDGGPPYREASQRLEGFEEWCVHERPLAYVTCICKSTQTSCRFWQNIEA